MTCAGDLSQICGDSWRLSAYKTGRDLLVMGQSEETNIKTDVKQADFNFGDFIHENLEWIDEFLLAMFHLYCICSFLFVSYIFSGRKFPLQSQCLL